MIALSLALDKVRGRPLAAGATFASIVLAVTLLTVLANARVTLQQRISEPVSDADLIVGPRGGSLDLFLSAGLNLAPPRGRTSPGLAEDLAADPRIARSAPLLLEDNYRGWPVVATTSAHPAFALNDDLSELMRSSEPVAVVGAAAARALNLRPGDRIQTAHQAAANHHYEVVSILDARSAATDRCLFVPLESVQHAHHGGHAAEVEGETHPVEESRHVIEANAILVTLKTPLDLLPLMRELNDLHEVTVVDPRAEAARLHAALGGLDRYLWAAGLAVLALAVLALIATLVTQVEERRRETAILRALGASFGHVIAVEMGHALIVAGAGAVLGSITGILLAHALDLKEAFIPLDLLVPVLALGLAAVVAAAACLPLYRVALDDALRPDR